MILINSTTKQYHKLDIPLGNMLHFLVHCMRRDTTFDPQMVVLSVDAHRPTMEMLLPYLQDVILMTAGHRIAVSLADYDPPVINMLRFMAKYWDPDHPAPRMYAVTQTIIAMTPEYRTTPRITALSYSDGITGAIRELTDLITRRLNDYTGTQKRK